MCRHLFIGFFIGMLIFLYSCDQNKTCIEPMTSRLKLEFFNTKTLKDTIFDSVIYQLHKSEVDTMVFIAAKAYGIELNINPLDTVSNIDLWIITGNYESRKVPYYIDSLSHATTWQTKNIWLSHTIRQESLQVTYAHSPVFVSYDCGFRTDFRLNTLVSTPGFDSISIIQKNISTRDEINCKVYFNNSTGK